MKSDKPLEALPWSRVLVTGGSGFIGSHVCNAIQHSWPQVELWVLDLTPPRITPHRFIQGSINCPETVRRACQGVGCVLHLAAMVSVEESMAKPLRCLETNVAGTLQLLEAARQEQVKRIVLSSSAAVYGDAATSPQSEDLHPAPLTPYGVSKLEGELYLELYRRNWGLSTASLRYFNVYGPGQDPNSPYAAVIPRFLQHAREGKPLLIFGDGSQTRDFVHVHDVARANLWAALQADLHGACNVSTGQPTTVLELAQQIKQLLNSNSEIRLTASRPGDIRESWADAGKLRNLGYHTGISLSQGLKGLVDFNQEVLEECPRELS